MGRPKGWFGAQTSALVSRLLNGEEVLWPYAARPAIIWHQWKQNRPYLKAFAMLVRRDQLPDLWVRVIPLSEKPVSKTRQRQEAIAWRAANRETLCKERKLRQFHAKVRIDDTTGCWEWQGSRNPKTGYGSFDKRSAHRYSYETFVGPLIQGMHVDHVCRNRGCCNPAHLEQVTPAENLRRSPVQISTINALKTHCKRGHALSGENVYVAPGGRGRACRTCSMARYHASRRGLTLDHFLVDTDHAICHTEKR